MDYTETGPRRMVEVVEYDPTWPEKFAQERASLAHVLPDALAIEHIGSTSVPGLCAKPTLDILIVVASIDSLLIHEPSLVALGYEQRDSFTDDEQHAFFRKVVNGRRTHHLHVLTQDSPRPQEYVLLRDYLRVDASAAEEYAQVKRDLAVQYATRRDRYVAEKSEYVTALLSKARHWRPHIDDLPT
jgi:GrpB-like predicted nucleotidyltransferase (UPF0157 family)